MKENVLIDNVLLNILLLPLKHTSLISCTNEKIDHFLDSNLQLINSSPFSKIFLQYRLLNKKNDLFKFNDEFKFIVSDDNPNNVNIMYRMKSVCTIIIYKIKIVVRFMNNDLTLSGVEDDTKFLDAYLTRLSMD
jgi:hypothetical protein